MISKSEIINLKDILRKEKSVLEEIEKLINEINKSRSEERVVLENHLEFLKNRFKKVHEDFKRLVSMLHFVDSEKDEGLRSKGGQTYTLKQVLPKKLERETIKRIQERIKKKNEKKEKKKDSEYLKISSKIFSKTSRKFLNKDRSHRLEKELIKANLNYTPVGYVSMLLMTTFLSVFLAGFLFLFFLFFNFGATLPIITRATETIDVRFFKTFWMLFVIPIGTFLIMYVYPTLEKSSVQHQIDAELPFATIHMAAISGAMVNPMKIFEIINSTKEYPALEREFNKMINEINVYGYDIINAMKNTAKNSPSKKLSELLNGLATTINSGGDLPKFFEKRSETLLFNYRIVQQKEGKAAETYMDLYISLLIAAPMILMLLMMIMKLSGLGISMTIPLIGLLITLGVVMANILFLVFLHVKRSNSG